ncbi:pantoate--beta-alanine ligase [Christiangramia sp. LLG6405-1]|uniref:pantoate--beta-alanine ligase n=1 Tax=Christiangramia sp. LLG6405-1 TaxID=3160832 RepID=UPI0038671A5E
MQVFREKGRLLEAIREKKSEEKSIGLVPTMGALHEGHLSLVQFATQQTDQVVVSIFVNPTQFDDPEDLEKYPRNLDKDIALLETKFQDLWIFSPNATELYDGKIVSQQFDFGGLENVMEGKFRNGHFNGVGTVVKKLFEATEPDKAFFGEKDFQQLQIIRKLTDLTKLPVEIIGCPILREDSGLARSSRNERLTDANRQKAALIYETLQTARELFGTKSAKEVTDWVETAFRDQDVLELEYFMIAETDSLQKIEIKEKEKQYRAFIAVYADDIRLIDNIALNN